MWTAHFSVFNVPVPLSVCSCRDYYNSSDSTVSRAQSENKIFPVILDLYSFSPYVSPHSQHTDGILSLCFHHRHVKSPFHFEQQCIPKTHWEKWPGTKLSKAGQMSVWHALCRRWWEGLEPSLIGSRWDDENLIYKSINTDKIDLHSEIYKLFYAKYL